MIPVLYDHSETSFTSNGIGRLVDCIRCDVTEERNGIFECEFEYPITGQHYSDIQIDRIIYVTHDDTKDPQPFDIYRRSAPINGIVTFYAHHISYRLGNILLDPFTATSCVTALASFNNYSMVENPFTFHTDKDVVANFSVTVPVSIKAVLGGMEGSILDVYGTGEYEWDDFDVNFWLHRGTDNGVKIRYSDSLSQLTHDLDYSSSYNTVAPYWANMDKTEIVTLPERYVFSNNAPTVSSNWTENGTTITDSDGNAIEFLTSNGKAVPLDLSESWEEAPTVEQLRAKAISYLLNSQAWVPSENLQVDFVALWQTEEYKNVAPLQTVSLCDTVTVLYPELGVNASVKVIKTVYDVLLERYKELELGEPRSSFAEVVSAKASAEVKESSSFLSSIAGEVERATAKITGMNGGHVIINSDAAGHPYEILVMDTDDTETAVNVMRINNAGIGFSTNGYNGPFMSAWTLDGHFVADFITAGTLSADLIRTGIIQGQTGGNWWNLDSGEFYTASDDRGVNIKNGRIYFYDPAAPDFSGFLSTYFVDGDTSQPAIGMFTTEDKIVFGMMDVRGNITESAIIDNGLFHAAGVSCGTIYNENTDTKYSIGCQEIHVGIDVEHDTEISHSNYVYGINPYGYIVGRRLNIVDDTSPAEGVIRCASVTQTSDRRFKNVQEWDERYIDAFDEFEPVLFRWIKGACGTHAGFIAQDVKYALEDEGLDPEGIVDESGENLTLNYTSIFTLACAKIQQQQKKIDELEKRLERLERMLECE